MTPLHHELHGLPGFLSFKVQFKILVITYKALRGMVILRTSIVFSHPVQVEKVVMVQIPSIKQQVLMDLGSSPSLSQYLPSRNINRVFKAELRL